MKKKPRKSNSHLLPILVALLAGLILIAVTLYWLILPPQINSYETCINDPATEWKHEYPFPCISQDGGYFIDPSYILDAKLIPPISQWETFTQNEIGLRFAYPKSLGIEVTTFQQKDSQSISIRANKKNLVFNISISVSNSLDNQVENNISNLAESINNPTALIQFNDQVEALEILPGGMMYISKEKNERHIRLYHRGRFISISQQSREYDRSSVSVTNDIINSIIFY